MVEKTTDSVNDEWRVFEIFKVGKISVYILNISPY
jgi:hypothetical protein